MVESVSADAVTARDALPETLLSAAVTVVEPVATGEAMPDALTVAMAEFATAQVAAEVTLAVEPSLYVAVAVNCSVAVIAMLAVPGVTAIAVTVFGVTVMVFEEPHPAMARSESAASAGQLRSAAQRD